MSRLRRSWRPLALSVVAALACGAVIASSSAGAATHSAKSSSKQVLSIAFGSTYVMATASLAPTYYAGIAKQFEAAHPGVTVNLVPIPGSPSDIVNKLSLLYRSPSTAPTIAEIDTQDVGKFAEADYLLPLNKDVKTTTWWGSMPSVVQNEATFSGNVDAVNQGENVQALVYNKVDFKKAGLPVPWHPKTWAAIISAAETIKKKLPHVTPIWADGGTSQGTVGVFLGVGNLLAGSSDPTVYDSKTKKWVVSSEGLRQTFTFIHELTADGLNAPVADLFNANAAGNVTAYIKNPGAAITIGSNYYGSSWLKNAAPSWPAAATTIGVAPIPTINGQGSDVASLLGGWDLGIYSGTSNKSLAWQLLNLMMQKNNLLTADNDGEWIPPVTSYASDPLYVNFAPPFQAEFAGLEKYASEWPSSQGLAGWSEGFQQATGQLEQSAGTTVDAALATMKQYASEQLGSGAVESQSK
jgi:multiple sugar transport system substrate-binding protein